MNITIKKQVNLSFAKDIEALKIDVENLNTSLKYTAVKSALTEINAIENKLAQIKRALQK
jgi:hypothetical protein